MRCYYVFFRIGLKRKKKKEKKSEQTQLRIDDEF